MDTLADLYADLHTIADSVANPVTQAVKHAQAKGLAAILVSTASLQDVAQRADLWVATPTQVEASLRGGAPRLTLAAVDLCRLPASCVRFHPGEAAGEADIWADGC